MNIGSITKTNGFKVGVLIVLILLFMIPLAMVQDIINERSRRSSGVEREIMASWGGEFLTFGPILQIPCKTYETFTRRSEQGDITQEIRETNFFLYIAPEELNVEVLLGTEIKKRGIFSVPLFAGTVKLSGRFNPGKILKHLQDRREAFPEQAELFIALADQRGIRGVETAEWNGGTIDFLPGMEGFASAEIQGGIHGAASANTEQMNYFNISIAVQGGKSLKMTPLGEETAITVQADWTAPSFFGGYLPVSHRIEPSGFEAQWRISHLSRNIPLFWEGNGEFASAAMFGVNFYKPLDHYGLNTRAVKYSFLFIIIPFLSFFLFELFLRRSIHPVQYILAGIGNVIFYLLLISFSERIPFSAAYWTSASAATAMLTLYSASLLGGWKNTPYIAGIMLLCYTFLYCTLQSEDWALLIGSIGAFAVTGFVMFITRKVDWYSGQWAKPSAKPEGDEKEK
ncbi:MAG: cell envelope integrity protein CreD [Spirochaetaceae bacterium]|jgi:inner membrane protein|nr:cell envelope integrity protein CreD [Spirochaetaceae bacterium]